MKRETKLAYEIDTDAGTYECSAGSMITNAIKEMCDIATETQCTLTGEFNGVKVTATPGSDPLERAEFWESELKRQGEEYRNSSEGKEAARQAEIREQQRQERIQMFAEKNYKMTVLPGLENEYAEWKQLNSTDGYSRGVVTYIERWAGLMEELLSIGPSLKFIADRTSHDADTEGVTGFMYGCAVAALAKFWIHGEELRKWHNLKTQIGNEGEKANESGGVLNPAVLTIGSKESA